MKHDDIYIKSKSYKIVLLGEVGIDQRDLTMIPLNLCTKGKILLERKAMSYERITVEAIFYFLVHCNLGFQEVHLSLAFF